MACCDLLLVRCRRLQRSAKCKYTHYRSTYCLVIRDADVTVWDSDPWKSRVWAFARKREITGEPLNSRSRILAPKWREITGVDCTLHSKWTLYNGCYASHSWRHKATCDVPAALWCHVVRGCLGDVSNEDLAIIENNQFTNLIARLALAISQLASG